MVGSCTVSETFSSRLSVSLGFNIAATSNATDDTEADAVSAELHLHGSAKLFQIKAYLLEMSQRSELPNEIHRS